MFARLFRGRTNVFGTYLYEKKSSNEVGAKVKGQAKTVKKKVTAKLYADHLSGKSSLGIVPITEEATCWFGAIDIDEFPLDLEALEEKIDQLALPLIICRTKSGGAHLYLFAKKQIPAVILRSKLKLFAQALGFPQAEIFPKQSDNSEETLGSWINLPYFNADDTERYAFLDGRELSLEEFYEAAKSLLISEKELNEINPPILLELDDAPPCLQKLCKDGITKGMKDTALFNLAVYAKIKYPDNWEEKLEEFNRLYVTPPATSQTMMRVIKPHRRKNYFYTCDNFPLSDKCDKAACKKAKYGINQEQPSVKIGKLFKVDSNPPIWYLEVEEAKIELSTEDLLSQLRFRRICVEKLNAIPRLLKEKTWVEIIQDRLDNLEKIAVPEDASPEGQFYYLLRVFCTELPPARTREEILQHKTWTEKGLTFFQSPDLLAFLQQKKFMNFKTNKIYELIRAIGGKTHTKSIKGVNLRLWSVPEFDKQEEDFEVPNFEGEY